MAEPRHIRIFLSSPGDVADERSIALQVIDQLPYDPLLRGKVTLEIVAWDKPGAGTPMLATMTPQAAINAGLPKPSECDIVIIIFWTRIGTPLPEAYKKPDGSQYWSGTEWEYEDAMQAAKQFKRPEVVIYRRTQEIALKPSEANFMQKYEQWKRVDDFFQKFIDPKSGAILQGYNQYQLPEDFRREFETHLKALVNRLITSLPNYSTNSPESAKRLEMWQGSPFPGLRAFTEADAPIFFGRGRETDDILKRLDENQFVAVVGASGSGKSSLVGAGLIPRLRKRAIPGSGDWLIFRFTPAEVGENPFMALAVQIAPSLKRIPREIADALAAKTETIERLCEQLLAGKPEWAQLLFFIDQFEELFTLVTDSTQRQSFIQMLVLMAQTKRIHTVVTLRSDFYHRCVDYPELATLLVNGTFPLSVPLSFALYEMISRPAERAGLVFEDGLPEQILQDTGNEPGSLALMAFALDELYHACKDSERMTYVAYELLGKVQGAIGKRAENTFEKVSEDAQDALHDVFRELVKIDEHGVVTRQRASFSRISNLPAAVQLVNALTDARLLVQNWDELERQNIIELSHEAMLRSWERLVSWLQEAREDIYLRQTIRNDVIQWYRKGKRLDDLYRGAKLEETLGWAERNPPTKEEQEFLKAALEHEQLEKARAKNIEVEILKDAIVRNISHELRTPLLQTKTAVALLAEEVGNTKLAEYALGATTRLESTIRNITQLANSFDNMEFVPVILREAIDISVRNLRRTWDHKDNINRIKLHMPDNMPLISADRYGIATVLQLLLDNALKFSEGIVEIRVHLVSSKAEICIQDFGIGIPKDKIDKIFDVFYQVDNSPTRRYGGIGSGLAIVKIILEKHQTYISVESELGKGSTFCFELPIAAIN